MKMNDRSQKKSTLHPLRDRRRDMTRDAFVEAAEIVIAEKGYDGATIQDIADSVGCAVGTIYRYFKTKEDLFNAMVTRHCTRMAAMTRAAADACEDPLEAVKASVAALVDYFNAHLPFFRIFYTSAPGGRALVHSNLRDEALAAYLDCKSREVDLIKKAQRRGTVRKDIPAEELLEFIHGVNVMALARWSVAETVPSKEKQLHWMWSLVSGGLAGTETKS
jgi:AcrR family transcriptional regulator